MGSSRPSPGSLTIYSLDSAGGSVGGNETSGGDAAAAGAIPWSFLFVRGGVPVDMAGDATCVFLQTAGRAVPVGRAVVDVGLFRMLLFSGAHYGEGGGTDAR